MTEIVLAVVVALVGGGGLASYYQTHRSGKKTDAEALSTLEPLISSWLVRMEGEIRDLRGEVDTLRAENKELRAEVEVLRVKLRTESKLRRQYRATLIELGHLEAGDDPHDT